MVVNAEEFWNVPQLTDEEWASLPPLVPKGEDRAAAIDRTIAGWLESKGHDLSAADRVAAGGFYLDRVALVDGNTGEPIDLGELLSEVEGRLREAGEPEEFRSRPDLHVILRCCRIDACSCERLNVRPRFTALGSRFGDGASFESATFGGFANFDSATFGSGASFDSATFGSEATFDSATFGFGASFASATFGGRFSLLNARFGGGGGIEGARAKLKKLETAPEAGTLALSLWRLKSWFAEKRRDFDWTRVRKFGELQILTRVSYLALVAVPLLAGGWTVLAAFMHRTEAAIAEAAETFDVSAERLEAAVASLPDAPTPAAEDAATTATLAIAGVRERVGRWSAAYRDQARRLEAFPLGLVLSFFAALFLALGHFVYQVSVSGKVKAEPREAFIARRNGEFRDASKGQRRDLLTRAFEPLGRVAELLPERRHPNLIARHGATVWVPSDLEELEKVIKDSPRPAEPELPCSPNAANDREANSTESEGAAAPEAGASTEAERESPPPTRGDDRLPKHSRAELDIIIIEEGARAEYDIAARESLARGWLSGALYLIGAYFVAWLIFGQSANILTAAKVWGFGPEKLGLVTAMNFFFGWIAGPLVLLAAIAFLFLGREKAWSRVDRFVDRVAERSAERRKAAKAAKAEDRTVAAADRPD
jgi:hypothetical protein